MKLLAKLFLSNLIKLINLRVLAYSLAVGGLLDHKAAYQPAVCLFARGLVEGRVLLASIVAG